MVDLSFGLEDRGVIVTGACGGIERATAAPFEAAGARVCAVDIDQAGVEDLIGSFNKPSRHLAIGLDLRDISKHKPLVDRVRSEFGNLHALARPAAILRRAHRVTEVSEEDWDAQLDVNLKSRLFPESSRGGPDEGAGHRWTNNQLLLTELVVGRLRRICCLSGESLRPESKEVRS